MEKRPRSLFAGGTDYTGVGMDVILDHLTDWRAGTRKTIEILGDCRAKVMANQHSFDSPQEINDYIAGFLDLFTRYQADFDLLVTQLPHGVLPRHVEMVDQIYRSSVLHEPRCVRFASESVHTALKDESTRPILDRIYGSSRDQIIDYKDLSNVKQRLEALVGMACDEKRLSIDDVDVFELKPNFFGIGLNLNHVIKRIGHLFGQK